MPKKRAIDSLPAPAPAAPALAASASTSAAAVLAAPVSAASAPGGKKNKTEDGIKPPRHNADQKAVVMLIISLAFAEVKEAHLSITRVMQSELMAKYVPTQLAEFRSGKGLYANVPSYLNPESPLFTMHQLFGTENLSIDYGDKLIKQAQLALRFLTKWSADFFKSKRLDKDRQLKTGMGTWESVLRDQVDAMKAAKVATKAAKTGPETAKEDGDDTSEDEDLTPLPPPPPPGPAPSLPQEGKRDLGPLIESGRETTAARAQSISVPRFNNQYWTLYCVVGPFARLRYSVTVPASFHFDATRMEGKARAE